VAITGNEDGVSTNGAIMTNDAGSDTDEGVSFDMLVFNPADSGNPVRMVWDISYEDTIGDAAYVTGGGQIGAGAQDMTGIKIIFVSGNIEVGTIHIIEEDIFQ